MKKITIALASFVASLSLMAQADDPVIMKINGKNITRSEFEYSFNKNNSDGVIDKKTVEEYVPLFVDFKLKVAEAESQKIDTISSIRKELSEYKEQMVVPTLVDSVFIENEARNTYKKTAERFEGQDLLTASHILIMLRQDATAEQEAIAKARIDSIYRVLKSVSASELSEKFAEMAKEKSDDKASGMRGGALGQFGKGMMIPDFEKAAFALKAGELSAPIKSTVGYHIIYMIERHPFEPYEYHRENILQFLDQRGIREASANAMIDSLANKKGMTRSQVIDELHEQLISTDRELRYLSQEYYDGTLMYEVAQKDVWDKAQKDTNGQEAFFKSHKKDYAWDLPHFAGIIMHAKDAATIAKAKSLLKGVAEEDYAKAVTSALNNDSVKVIRVEKGIFKIGENANVDKLAFKQSCELKPMKDFEATDVYGKVLKAPRTSKDVRGQVTTDYQNALEKKWVDGLRKKFEVFVFEDVVKTVNKH